MLTNVDLLKQGKGPCFGLFPLFKKEMEWDLPGFYYKLTVPTQSWFDPKNRTLDQKSQNIPKVRIQHSEDLAEVSGFVKI